MAAPVSTSRAQVVCFRVLPETNRLVVIMHGGDLAVLSLDDEEPVVRNPMLAYVTCNDAELLWLITKGRSGGNSKVKNGRGGVNRNVGS